MDTNAAAVEIVRTYHLDEAVLRIRHVQHLRDKVEVPNKRRV